MAMKVKLHNTKAKPQGHGAAPYKAKAQSVDALYGGRTPGKHSTAEKAVDKNHGGNSSFMVGTRRTVQGS
jgi:hypothetical protein